MLRRRCYAFALVSLVAGLSPGRALASAITTADVSITAISITADQPFVGYLQNQFGSAQAGPDNLFNESVDLFDHTSPVDRSIANATAHADFGGTDDDFTEHSPGTIVTNGHVHASTGVTLTGTNDSSQSSASATDFYEFAAIGQTTGVTSNVTLSITFNGLLTGQANALGTYVSELTAEFSYENSAGAFVPVDFLDQKLTGGPSDNQQDVVGPFTLTGTVPLVIGQDQFFEATVTATSSAVDSTQTPPSAVPEPATLLLCSSALAFGRWRGRQRG
jgi:hypothetical protein